jgi:hypothetical protein
MIYLVEKLNAEGRPSLGTDGRHIFKQYASMQSLERYQIRRLTRLHGRLWVSEYSEGGFYGKPLRVWQYEFSQTHARGFWKCIIWKE